jgi:hypothetical protein
MVSNMQYNNLNGIKYLKVWCFLNSVNNVVRGSFAVSFHLITELRAQLPDKECQSYQGPVWKSSTDCILEELIKVQESILCKGLWVDVGNDLEVQVGINKWGKTNHELEQINHEMEQIK